MSTRLESEPSALEGQPTILRLFHEPKDRLDSLRVLSNELRLFTQQGKRNQDHWERKTQEVSAAENKLGELMKETADQQINLVSSVSTGLAYLKFMDDLTAEGFSPDQIFEFFKGCLAINIRRSDKHMDTINATSSHRAGAQRLESLDFIRYNLTPLAHQLISADPLSLGKDHQRYKPYIEKYCAFHQILNPDLPRGVELLRFNAANIKSFEETGRFATRIFGFTYSDGMPDWLLDKNSLPQRDEVADELDEDKKALEDPDDQYVHLSKQYKFIRNLFDEKYQKATDWLENRLLKLIPPNPDLAEILLILKNFSQNQEQSIRNFSQKPDRFQDPQTLALFIEDVFKTAQILQDGSINKGGSDLLKSYLANLNSESNGYDQAKFSAFRDANKKGYDGLKFDLGRFLTKLTGDDLDLFDEFLDQSSEDGEATVEFLADLLSTCLRNLSSEDFRASPLKPSVEKYREFLRKFLRQNWQNLFEQLYQVLFPKSAFEAMDDEQGLAAPDQATTYLSEVEENLNQVNKGELSSWQVYYAHNLDRPDHILTAIEGQTLDEKALFLQNFFTQQGISCSIKTTSLVSALEWKTEYPEELEALVPTKKVGEISWKKIKRGAVRIFYQRDVSNRRLTFSVHQKKAWLYGF